MNHGYYKISKEIQSDKLSESARNNVWQRVRIDFELTQSNKRPYHVFETMLAPGIRQRRSKAEDEMEAAHMSLGEVNTRNEMHMAGPIPRTEEMIYNSAVTIINSNGLWQASNFSRSFWLDQSDNSMDPNYYDGEYVLPDGGTYTIVKHINKVRVYEGPGFFCFAMHPTWTVCEFNIDPVGWAEIYYKNK